MSLRATERELGIHRATIKKNMDAEGPPTLHPGRLLLPRRHLIPSKPNRVMFSLNN